MTIDLPTQPGLYHKTVSQKDPILLMILALGIRIAGVGFPKNKSSLLYNIFLCGSGAITLKHYKCIM